MIELLFMLNIKISCIYYNMKITVRHKKSANIVLVSLNLSAGAAVIVAGLERTNGNG